MRLSSWSVPTASIRPPSRGRCGRRPGSTPGCGDQEGRPVLGEFFDRLADQQLVLDVDGAGCLVEDQDGRVAKHGTGQRDSLTLAAGKPIAPFADQRVVPLRKRDDELMGVGALGRPLDGRAAGMRKSVGDVVGDRVLKQDRLLNDHADLVGEGCGAGPR